MDTAKDADIVIDETVRFKGTVLKWSRRRGFGYIVPEGKGESDKVFALWRQIESSDEWPALKEGLVVEYYVGKKEGAKRKSQKQFAAKITLEGGNPVSLASEKVYPNRSQRFQGTIKFFDPRKGFGFVKPSTEFTFDGQTFKAGEGNIHIARDDIKTTADIAPSLKKGTEIQFCLYKLPSSKNSEGYRAGDVTKVGGESFGEDELMTKRTGWPKKRRQQKNQGFGPMKGFNMKGMKGMKMMNMGGMPMVMMGGMPYMMMPTMMNQNKKRKGKKGKKKGSW